MQAGNIVSTYDASPSIDALHLPGSAASPGRDGVADGISKRIQVWAHDKNFTVDVKQSNDIHLSHERCIELNINCGWNSVKSGTITLRPASAGLRLHIGKAVAQGDIMVETDASHHGRITFKQAIPGNSFAIMLPYDLENVMNEITVRVEAAYETEAGEFTYASKETVAINLPLAVNVQDSFHLDKLISRFTIGSSTSSPVRILATDFKGNDTYAVSTFSDGLETNLVPQQTLSLVTQIRRIQGRDKPNPGGQYDRRLYLIIHYCCLRRQIISDIQYALLKMLRVLSMQRYSRLLSQHVAQHLRDNMNSQDLEDLAKSNKMSIGPFEWYKWDEVLHILPLADSGELRRCLLTWHSVGDNGRFA